MGDMLSEPVMILSALFWIDCKVEMFVLHVVGYQIGAAYPITGLIMAL